VQKYGIGQAVRVFEDPRLVRGGGRYVDDMVLPDGVRLRAAIAHAMPASAPSIPSRPRQRPASLAVLTEPTGKRRGGGDLPGPAA